MDRSELYVGIDVASAKIDVAFIDAEARTVRPSASYPNDPDGWTALKTTIIAAASLLGEGAWVVCGMESTSNMHKRLEQALRAEKRRKLQVHVLNPRAVKHFAKALLKDAKTDRLDSQTIAQFMVRMKPEPSGELPDRFEELKEATRTRRRLVEERTDHKNRLHKFLRYYLPGYRKVLGIRQLPKRLLRVLVEVPSPHLLLERSPEELARIRYGRGHRVGETFAKKLHTVAAHAPGLKLPNVTRMLIETTARRILDLDDLLSEVDQAIADLLDAVFPHQVLTTIPGIGKTSAAAVVAEAGDVTRFKTKTEFIGYCGLYPIVWESGEVRKRYRMTRKGNRMLKMTLLVASAAARQYNPVIAQFYDRLRARGKSKKAAGGAIARKLAELVFTLLVRGEPWSANKAMRGMQKADAMLRETAKRRVAGAPCLTGEIHAHRDGPRA